MKGAIWMPGEEPDVSFIPPMQRRRLSLLQKGAFYLAHAVGADEARPLVVFASKFGEFRLSHRLVADFNGGEGVSPQRFSASVHNAAPGLYSIFSKNTENYTAIAADDATIECGLLEAVRRDRTALWLYAEEHERGHGAAILFEKGDAQNGAGQAGCGQNGAGQGCGGIVVSAGDSARPLLTFEDVCKFIRGKTATLKGRFVTVTVEK